MSVAVATSSAIAQNPAAGQDSTRTGLLVVGTLTLTGSYVTYGDTMSLAGLCSSDYAPEWVRIWQEPTAGNAPVIYCFLWARGTTQANGRLIVTDFAGAEIAASAYPAALTATGATAPGVRFEALFAKSI